MTLRYRIVLGLMAFTLLPLAGAALAVHYTLTKHLEQNAGRELAGRVGQTTATINAFLRQRQSDVRIFASSQALASGSPEEMTARLEQLVAPQFLLRRPLFHQSRRPRRRGDQSLCHRSAA